MSIGKIIGYIFAGILLLFGVLFLLAAFSPEAASPGGRLAVGAILVIIAIAIIVAIRLREPKPEQQVTIHQKIDIGGDVEMETLKCRNCGAELDKSAISVQQGAVMVTCPYCNTTYQIVEEPKW
jgi:DNA-directed RNA polymerase subunit RPC12/RpoP